MDRERWRELHGGREVGVGYKDRLAEVRHQPWEEGGPTTSSRRRKRAGMSPALIWSRNEVDGN